MNDINKPYLDEFLSLLDRYEKTAPSVDQLLDFTERLNLCRVTEGTIIFKTHKPLPEKLFVQELYNPVMTDESFYSMLLARKLPKNDLGGVAEAMDILFRRHEAVLRAFPVAVEESGLKEEYWLVIHILQMMYCMNPSRTREVVLERVSRGCSWRTVPFVVFAGEFGMIDASSYQVMRQADCFRREDLLKPCLTRTRMALRSRLGTKYIVARLMLASPDPLPQRQLSRLLNDSPRISEFREAFPALFEGGQGK